MALHIDRENKLVVSPTAIDQFREQVMERLALQQQRAGQYAVDAAVDADPVTWIMQNFYIPETGKPMQLYPSQEAPMREALRRDESGNFVYSTVLWSAIKKSAKSSIAAAVGMWFAYRKPMSSIKVLGNDLKQAESRVYEYMRRAVLLREDWRSTIKVNNYKMTFPNGSTIEAIPVDPTGEAGGNDDLLLYTELWGWKSLKHQQMWTESTLSPTKYGKSLRWCESYAGYSGESPVLEQLYETAVVSGRVISDEYEMYAADHARLFALWNTRPNLPWQTPEYYAQEAASLIPSEYSRVHQNKWGTSTTPFLEDMSWWNACKGDLPDFSPSVPCVVGLDAGVSNDCFAVVTTARQGETIYKRASRIWKPPPGGKIQFSDPNNPENRDTPEGYCRWLAKTYNVVEFTYDPYQLHDFATRLQRDGVGWFRPFNQGAERAVADKHLYDLIVGRRLVHDGDPELTQHIQNANRVPDKENLRLVKRAEQLKIDGAVALSMSCREARRLNIG